MLDSSLIESRSFLKSKLLKIYEGGYMKEKGESVLQWHPAFFAGLQIELEDEAECLEFENEHMLSSKPMQLDVLIIKKNRDCQIQKNIGRIFRTYNIVEYKSPDDYLCIDDFYKVYGYACFYKADTGKVDAIKTEEITISFVGNHYPRELFRYLEEKRNCVITEAEQGIYYISDVLFQIQVIVQKQLSEETNLWLRSLTNDLKDRKKVENLLWAYKKRQTDRLYRSVMQVIVNANRERFQVNDMCDALDEILEYHFKGKLEEGRQQGIAEGRAEGIAQGEQKTLFTLVEKKIAKGKSLAQIADELEETEEAILPIYKKAMGE